MKLPKNLGWLNKVQIQLTEWFAEKGLVKLFHGTLSHLQHQTFSTLKSQSVSLLNIIESTVSTEEQQLPHPWSCRSLTSR